MANQLAQNTISDTHREGSFQSCLSCLQTSSLSFSLSSQSLCIGVSLSPALSGSHSLTVHPAKSASLSGLKKKKKKNTHCYHLCHKR